MKYDATYPVEETFQLFKIPWEWYNPKHTYDVVIARKEEVGTIDAYLVNLSEKDYFAEIAQTLNEGLSHCHEPVVDILIDELRQILKEHTILVEIPPVPWEYSYIVALTHDVDITSVRERRWVSVGYAAYQCLRKGQVKDAFQIFGAKCGITKDPWNCFDEWMRLEEELDVRSTWYFLPEKGEAGQNAPTYRAGYYDLNPELIRTLTDGGWEAGVHGLDNWCDITLAKKERKLMSDITGTDVGTRVHWLLFDKDSWKTLDEAGYTYDSTFGYNDDVGFQAGTMQAFRPAGTHSLYELPLHIQDMALFGTFCWLPNGADWEQAPCLNLSEEQAMERCTEIFQYAQKYGGAITILWHQVSIAAPKRWGKFYRVLIKMALCENAWVTHASQVCEWYRMRRNIHIYIKRNDQLGVTIEIVGNETNTSLPGLRLRVFTDSKKVKNPECEYSQSSEYLDIFCRKQIMEILFDDT